MDKKFCDNCGQEIWDKEWLELTIEGKTIYSREKTTTCSYRCMEDWINSKRRHVIEDSNKSTKAGIVNLVDKYYNVEIGGVNIDECIQEPRAFNDPWLVVKPEIWRSRMEKR